MILTASGSRKAKAVPLIMGDSVEKADIEICKHPSGKGDWLLGTGASGKVVHTCICAYSATQLVCHRHDCYVLCSKSATLVTHAIDVCKYTRALAVCVGLHHLSDHLVTAYQVVYLVVYKP